MSRLDTMISFFSCGCHVEGDIPTLSRCEEHNGFVVVCHNQNVQERSFKSERGTVWQGTLLHNLRRLRDDQFSYIFAYPEHQVLNAMKWVTPKAWRDTKMEMMYHLKRILKPGGYISMVVDPDVSNTVVYQAAKLKLKIDVRPFTFEYFEKEPYSTSSFAFADAKAHYILYKGYREKIPKSGSCVLDISGIKIQHVEKRKKDNKLLVLTGHNRQFDIVKNLLGG